ncbi:MAG: shikimate dehydrogenase [Verrucomicrobiales bacterium]|nr:shikimate dehydrogenase [Verrucomicrobiales bacterium]MCP5556395.1 shikimate dehydrogenase [Verrucomicrobiaceae bacterium]
MADFYTLDDLRSWPEHTGTLTPPARLAVIGDPIGHSRSPQMHNPALVECGIDAQYVRVQVPQGSVAEAFGLFAQHGFLGVNITIPHKFEALEAVHHLDPLAKQLGAVNTLVIREGGRLHGYNTDGPGFLRSVREAFGTDVRDLRVLILGAGGGAGRAVAVQCAMEGCWRLVLANRTHEKAAQVAKELRGLIPQPSPNRDISTVAWDDAHLHAELENIDLIVNATSVGMKMDDAPLLPASGLRPHHLVLDMVYRPGGRTPLVQDTLRAGGRAVDGLTLLLHQGAISFEHWFDRPAPVEVMRQGLQATVAA